MKTIPHADVQAIIHRDKVAGGRGDDRATKESASDSSRWFDIGFHDQESFFSLIWHDMPCSRILSHGSLRLGDVARLQIERGWSFGDLASEARPSDLKAHGEYDPSYFAGCLSIDRGFDYSRFSPPILVLPNDQERRRAPAGSFYLMDGTHRTLVLARKLLLRELQYRPVTGLLLLPRP